MKFRKVLPLVLSIVLLFVGIPFTAAAEVEGDFEYTIADGAATITGYHGAGGDVVVPSELGGTPVKRIEEFAFSFSLVDSVVVSEGVTEIGKLAFRNSILKQIRLPSSVENIGDWIFSGCDELTEIIVAEDNQAYASRDGVLFNKDYTELIWYPASRTDTSYAVPEGVTSIDVWAFEACTNLTSVMLPDSLIRIGDSAFVKCTGLTSITIPDSVTDIGQETFSHCSDLASVRLPDGITSIGQSTFARCKSLTSIEIPNSVTSISIYAFAYCTSLASITLPNESAILDESVFAGCTGLERIEFSENTTTIAESTFYGCTGLTQVTIPDSVTSIGDAAFSGCKSLTSVTVPANVENIGAYAFYECPNLTVYGDSGSTAEKYALDNRIPFVSLGQAEIARGDINIDSRVDAQDALLALQHSVKLITLDSLEIADVDRNDIVDARDALLILQKSVGLITSFSAAA